MNEMMLFWVYFVYIVQAKLDFRSQRREQWGEINDQTHAPEWVQNWQPSNPKSSMLPLDYFTCPTRSWDHCESYLGISAVLL